MKEITISKSISGSGIGLHKGTAVAYELSPLPSGSGVVFYRRDLGRYYEAHASRVINTQMATVIGDEHGFIATIEHLMSAIAAFGIDNLQITLDAAEAPVFDGSAAAWCSLLREAGLCECDAPKELIFIKNSVRVEEGAGASGEAGGAGAGGAGGGAAGAGSGGGAGASASAAAVKYAQITPATNGVHYDFEINFAHPAIGRQRLDFAFGHEAYIAQIAPARTFGFLHEVEALKARGLALGGSLDNAVVLGDEVVLNPGGLRFSDEFVRHKILDAIGDLRMMGRSVLGSYRAFAGSHALNNRLCAAIAADAANYEIIRAEWAPEALRSCAFAGR